MFLLLCQVNLKYFRMLNGPRALRMTLLRLKIDWAMMVNL